MTGVIRLLISDIDGTVVRPDKTLAEATVVAFGRLREAGIAASLISARPPSGMVGIAEELGIVHPLAAFNGGTIFTADGQVQARARLKPDVVQTALALAENHSVDIWLFAEGCWYARAADNPRVLNERLSAQIEPTLVSDLTAVDACVDKIVFVSEDNADLQRLEYRARTCIGTGATISLSQPYFLDVTAPAANKGDGVEELARMMGVPLAATAVIGDMTNDLPMLTRAGMSIAMGQAPGEVRAAADWVTKSDAEDGAASAIDHLLMRIVESAT